MMTEVTPGSLEQFRKMVIGWDIQTAQGRRIFADWLEEQGEGLLACYTRFCCDNYSDARWEHNLYCWGCFRNDYHSANGIQR